MVQGLFPLICQCKAIDSETLKSSKLHLVRQLNNHKNEFYSEYETLLDRLNSLMNNILIKGLEDNLKKSERDKVSSYCMELQVEVANKISKLSGFQTEINSRCLQIIAKTDLMDLTSPAVVQGQAGPAPPPCGQHYNSNPLFISQTRQKPWFTTASDQLTVGDITVIGE